MAHVAPGATGRPVQVSLAAPNWSACRKLAVMPRVPVPLFVTVTVWGTLVPRTRTLPKLRLVADKETPAAVLAGMPVPPRSTDRWEPSWSWARSEEAVWGVKVTVKVQLAPASSATGQPSARKSPELVLGVIETPMGTLPPVIFVTLRLFDSDWPCVTTPRSRAEGVTITGPAIRPATVKWSVVRLSVVPLGPGPSTLRKLLPTGLPVTEARVAESPRKPAGLGPLEVRKPLNTRLWLASEKSHGAPPQPISIF